MEEKAPESVVEHNSEVYSTPPKANLGEEEAVLRESVTSGDANASLEEPAEARKSPGKITVTFKDNLIFNSDFDSGITFFENLLKY